MTNQEFCELVGKELEKGATPKEVENIALRMCSWINLIAGGLLYLKFIDEGPPKDKEKADGQGDHFGLTD